MTQHCLVNNKKGDPRCIAVITDDYINGNIILNKVFYDIVKE